MLEDIVVAIKKWRFIHIMGILSIRGRYARSRLGQLWMTLSMFLLIFSTGIVWSLIWHQPIEQYLPYIAAGHVFYLFISATISDSTGILIADSRLYINESMPRAVSIFIHIYKNIIILLHNLPIVIGVVLWSSMSHFQLTMSIIPSFVLTMIFLYCSSYIVAIICTRFRDLIQLVTSLMQIAFLVTPVMWNINMLPKQVHFYVLLNPFASCLELLRNPFIGLPVDSLAYPILLGWTIFTAIFAFILHSWMEKEIIFWI